ncbi:MAG: hypothetical protein WBP00_19085, partial [Saprospiraceae bacterium]
MSFKCFRFLVISIYFLLSWSEPIQGQAPILISIETKDNALILATDLSNRLLTTYFGKRLHQPGDYSLIASQTRMNDGNAGVYNNVYSSSGSTNLVEPAL